MSEASYTAWDDNLYAWPPPEGWYQASDGRWWPSGYGPAAQQPTSGGPAAQAMVPGSGGQDPYDQRTSAIPAGGVAPSPSSSPSSASASGPGPADRVEAETPRRVFDELPPIDDVFGGIDPYADDDDEEEAAAGPGSDPGPAVDRGPGPAGSDGGAGGGRSGVPGPDPADHGYFLLGPAGQEPGGAVGNGSLSGPSAIPPPPSSLLGDPGGANGSASDRSAPRFDEATRVFTPASSPPPPPPPSEAAVAGHDPTGPVAGGPAGPSGPPPPPPPPPVDVGGPGRPPEPDWAPATTILPRDDDGATSQLDLDALAGADRSAASARGDDSRRGDGYGNDRRQEVWGPGASWADDDPDRRPGPAERDQAPAGAGGTFHRDLAGDGGPGGDLSARSGGYGDYGDLPVGAAPAPRRWWPLVAIGLAVLAAAASIGGYLLLRDDSESSATDGGDPATDGPPGSFASPYPFGKVVVVYYNDEATKEQRRWVIQVLAPVADATQQLVGEGTAPAPGQGEVLALTRVRVTYQSGPEPGSLSDLRFKAVGATSGTEFDGSVACPAAAPLDGAAEVTVLNSAEGDLCWRIPQGELASLKLAVEAEAADGTVHMELNAPAG